MKTFKISLAILRMIIVSVILFSCEKEQTQSPIKDKSNISLKSGYAGADCNTAFLEEGPYEQSTATPIYQNSELPHFNGYYRHNKSLKTDAWNDENNFYIKITTSGYSYGEYKDPGKNGQWHLTGRLDSNYPFSSLIFTLNGTATTYSMDTPVTTYIQSFPLPTGWSKCDTINYSVSEVQCTLHPLVITQQSYTLFALSSVCEESFSYTADDNLNVVFTYISPGDLNAEFIFSCPDIIQINANDLKNYIQSEDENGQILVYTASLSACVPITFDITFEPNCSQNPPNIWTDFKVNGSSKKNSLTPDILYSGCK